MFTSKKLSKFKMIRHGFFNRFGGVSKGIYKGLNCGLGSDDKKRDVKENIKKVCQKIGCDKNNLVLLDQIPVSYTHLTLPTTEAV